MLSSVIQADVYAIPFALVRIDADAECGRRDSCFVELAILNFTHELNGTPHVGIAT